eukprot:356712-Chlamydomonas_euryale.AAC.5
MTSQEAEDPPPSPTPLPRAGHARLVGAGGAARRWHCHLCVGTLRPPFTPGPAGMPHANCRPCRHARLCARGSDGSQSL